MRARTRFVMLPAIQFDGQVNRRRIEIEDAIARDVLAKKANAIDLTQSQVLPEFAFGQRLVAAQLARASFHGCVIHHDLDSFRAVQATRSNLPHPSNPLSRVRGSKAFSLQNISKSHPPLALRARSLRFALPAEGGSRTFPSEHQQKPSPSIPLPAEGGSRTRRAEPLIPFQRKREAAPAASRFFSPPSRGRGSTRSVGGMPSAPYARDTAPSRTCTRTATSD